MPYFLLLSFDHLLNYYFGCCSIQRGEKTHTRMFVTLSVLGYHSVSLQKMHIMKEEVKVYHIACNHGTLAGGLWLPVSCKRDHLHNSSISKIWTFCSFIVMSPKCVCQVSLMCDILWVR